MTGPDARPVLLLRTELEKAAADNGFRLERGRSGEWLGFGSTTSELEIWLAGASLLGPWWLSLSNEAVASELGVPRTNVDGPAAFTFELTTTADLHNAIDRAWRLSVSLPSVPLAEFEAKVLDLPRTTETERLAVQRVGQDVFRAALMKYWAGRCPLTGIVEPALLRASHIVPWAECVDDAQRLDVHNGLLLSALWDAAFDGGLVSFGDDGRVLVSDQLGHGARTCLGLEPRPTLSGLSGRHCANLTWHRTRYGFPGG